MILKRELLTQSLGFGRKIMHKLMEYKPEHDENPMRIDIRRTIKTKRLDFIERHKTSFEDRFTFFHFLTQHLSASVKPGPTQLIKSGRPHFKSPSQSSSLVILDSGGDDMEEVDEDEMRVVVMVVILTVMTTKLYFVIACASFGTPSKS